LLPKRHGGHNARKGLVIGAVIGTAAWVLFFVAALWFGK
jgi:hypothetical protein